MSPGAPTEWILPGGAMTTISSANLDAMFRSWLIMMMDIPVLRARFLRVMATWI